MSTNKAQEAATSLREEAIMRMRRMLDIAVVEDTGEVERLVDCLILASVMQITSWQEKALTPMAKLQCINGDTNGSTT